MNVGIIVTLPHRIIQTWMIRAWRCDKEWLMNVINHSPSVKLVHEMGMIGATFMKPCPSSNLFHAHGMMLEGLVRVSIILPLPFRIREFVNDKWADEGQGYPFPSLLLPYLSFPLPFGHSHEGERKGREMKGIDLGIACQYFLDPCAHSRMRFQGWMMIDSWLGEWSRTPGVILIHRDSNYNPVTR